MLKLNFIESFFAEKDAFTKWLLVSAGAHISFVLFITLKSLIFPSQTFIIENALKVDLIGLPDKKPDTPPKKVAQEKAETKPEPAPPKAEVKPEPKKPEPKKPEPVNISKDKANQASAIEKLKQMSAIDKIKNATKNEPVKAPSNTVENLPQFKGNQVVAGNSFTGIAGLTAQDYFSDAKAHLQNFWALPEWLASAQLRASVLVMINQSGQVVRFEIQQSSGESAFDDAALAAVDAASPFPVPPENIRDTITRSWMIFNFPQ